MDTVPPIEMWVITSRSKTRAALPEHSLLLQLAIAAFPLAEDEQVALALLKENTNPAFQPGNEIKRVWLDLI